MLTKKPRTEKQRKIIKRKIIKKKKHTAIFEEVQNFEDTRVTSDIGTFRT